ncbi:MAG: TatD family hydrolase [Deltaproteobacteria bacterium]|nr:TatD family hydrolase [Deltaproteobacteria bacterium]
MLIDSHAHLDMDEYGEDLDQVLERAVEGGISNIIAVGIDLESSIKAIEIAGKYDFVYSTVGYHPHNVKHAGEAELKKITDLASCAKVVGWGEIGLDFFKEYSPRGAQIDLFKRQMEIATDLEMPVIIHDREAHGQLFEIVSRYRRNDNERIGVIHCFSGEYDLAMAFIEMGYYISIPGTVTYKKADEIRDVAKRIPLERMLIETDSPFLAPVPKRGKRNEPLYVSYTARMIAQLRDMDFDELAGRTSENARILFGINK